MIEFRGEMIKKKGEFREFSGGKTKKSGEFNRFFAENKEQNAVKN